MDQIISLHDVRPGDLVVTDISGLVGLGVALGEIAIGDGFRVGECSARHIGIVTEAADWAVNRTGVSVEPDGQSEMAPPKMAQAMPGGANIISLTPERHWTPKTMFIRLPEDYPGQALDAAAIAVAMVQAGVAYSPLSYGAIALAWRGIDPPSLMRWIDRRRPAVDCYDSHDPHRAARPAVALPVEAICSVFFDQAWTLAGKSVMPKGTPSQLAVPGGLARTWFRAPGTVCGGAGLLESA